MGDKNVDEFTLGFVKDRQGSTLDWISRNPNVLFPSSNSMGGNAFQDLGSNDCAPYNSPYYFHGESSNEKPMYHHRVQHPSHSFDAYPLVYNHVRPYGNMLQNHQFDIGTMHNSPYYFHGESSNERLMYHHRAQHPAFQENPHSFNAYLSVYNHVLPCGKMHQNYQSAMGTVPYQEGGVMFRSNSSLCEAEARKSNASRILHLMTREDGCDKLAFLWERCLERKDVLVCAITKYEENVLVRAAKDSNGIKSVKLLIELVKDSNELCEYVTSALEQGVLELMMHPNGPQLVLHCLQTLKYEQNIFLFDAACNNMLKLIQNENGNTCHDECFRFSQYPHLQKFLDLTVYYSVMPDIQFQYLILNS